MFGIPVRVHPLFWLVCVLLSPISFRDENFDFPLLALWVGCVFVSILIHELGHVVAGKIFGSHGHIVLYSFGGLAIGSSNLNRRWQRVCVSFAGPLAGFILLALAWGGLLVAPRPGLPKWTVQALLSLTYINLFWGVLNLLPLWPLDGGRISREFFEWLMPRSGTRVSLGISLLTGGLLAVQALSGHFDRPLIPWLPIGGLWNALFFGSLAFGSYFELRQLNETRGRWDYPDDPWHNDDRNRWER